MCEGDLIICPEGEYGIVAECRGNNLVVIEVKKDGTPFLDYYPREEVKPAPADYSADKFQKLYEFYNITKDYSKTQRKSSAPTQKRFQVTKAKTTKYIKRVPKPGGGYRYIYKKVKAPSVKVRRSTEEEKTFANPKVRMAQAWKKHMTPTSEQYKKIVDGDREALGQYLMKALWEPAVGQVETVKNVSITQMVSDLGKRITGVRPEGFEPEDVMQEVAIRLMEQQDSGKFKDDQVPLDKFASYVAQMVRNTSLEILRKQRLDKFADKDISEWADSIADVREQEPDEKMEHERDVEKLTNTLKNAFNALSSQEKILKNKVLNKKGLDEIAKEMNITGEAVKQRLKRIDRKLQASLQTIGLKIPPGKSKRVTQLINQVLHREVGRVQKFDEKKAFKAKVILRAGKLILKAVGRGKPAQAGEIRVHGGVRVRKDASGKWVPVGREGAGKPQAGASKKVPGKKDEGLGKMKKEQKQKLKDMVKNFMKNMVEALGDTYAGKGGGEAAAAGAQQVGAETKGMKRTQQAIQERSKKLEGAEA